MSDSPRWSENDIIDAYNLLNWNLYDVALLISTLDEHFPQPAHPWTDGEALALVRKIFGCADPLDCLLHYGFTSHREIYDKAIEARSAQ